MSTGVQSLPFHPQKLQLPDLHQKLGFRLNIEFCAHRGRFFAVYTDAALFDEAFRFALRSGEAGGGDQTPVGHHAGTGFRDHYRKAVHRGRREVMGALLQKVVGNLDDDLEASLILAGLPPKRLETIRELAADYHVHTSACESCLGQQRELTVADRQALNALYAEVMSIAKKAKHHFLGQPVIRERFILRKVSVYAPSGKKQTDTGEDKPAA